MKVNFELGTQVRLAPNVLPELLSPVAFHPFTNMPPRVNFSCSGKDTRVPTW